MQNPHTHTAILKHLANEENAEEKLAFLSWFNENDANKTLFNKVKKLWDSEFVEEKPGTFLDKFTFSKIQDFIVNQALGNFIGFYVGLTVTHMFSHYVTEKKSIKNLFGLMHRKKVIVNDAPEWVQWTLSVVAGFIALEFISYFFQSKKHIMVWNYLKKQLQSSNLKA